MERSKQESRLRLIYRMVYDTICGKHPNVRPWHFQWLGTFYLRRTLKKILPKLKGRVLDVGCGDKPYRALFTEATEYVGLDIAGTAADIIVEPDAVWPLDDESFDVVLATQVIEHVENLPHTLREIARVCKAGGIIILSFPFIYNEHGIPYDFWRFSAYGATKLFGHYEVVFLERQGGVGSTVTILILNWINDTLSIHNMSRLLKGFLLPVWIPFCAMMNMIGLLLDRLDVTGRYYNNVLVVYKKV